VIVAYAHITIDPNDVTKYQFYDMFSDLVVAIPACDVMLILGDFNAQVNSDFSI
jgi:propanediol utilization protein